ncbi:MAG: protein kinase [Pirellulales bacterium]|nr:protein kinase [Pirellulales bacterium]
MSTPLLNKMEPIAGYTIRERIGAGGYGEVWKAEAPGGLEKAVKFVYGQLDETRAACELKALNRVKEARHPFLLSLERVEVVDGQLIIVTELAEKSLKDRFDECRQLGEGGIPRDELLRYLADAADALDYIRQRYSLQHLDIKPENLLIVGGHVKVGDFGLVKDLKHTHLSFVEGLTPVYAPPEAFDDTISSTSDQYSLAIVYQEMLTGVLPFPGRTASQLSMQHRYSRPQLGALPESDRAAIAKALAKDPADRFSACLAMVEALMGRNRLGGDSKAGAGPLPGQASTGDTTPGSVLATELIRELDPKREAGPQLRPAESTLLAIVDAPEPARDLPPVPWTDEGPRLRPALFLGIGGTAARVFRRLRARLRNRLGDVHAVPCLAMLLVDTDRREIHNAVQGSETAALDARETLLMPLRRPEHYRAGSDRLLKWLSRRWLYNIPSSNQTEGLRPLGRLALVEHSQDLSDRLRAILQTVTSQESLSASAAATGWEIAAGEPRVYVVASISGGTGGGMVIDAAYLVRQALRELGLADEATCGILLHGPGRQSRDAGLSVANACACLMELEQFCREGYPGDEACSLPAFGRGAAFHDTYLVHQGNDLDERGREQAADAVAEYLYLNAATGAGRFFDACRRSPTDHGRDERPGVRFRSFGLSRAGCLHSELVGQTADLLSAGVLRRWCGETVGLPGSPLAAGPSDPRAKVEQAASRIAEECIEKSSLAGSAVAADVRRLEEEVLGSPREQFARGVLGPVLAAPHERSPQEILAEITAAAGPPLGEARPDEFSPVNWQWRLSARARELARNRAKAVREEIWEIAERAGLSVPAIRHIVQRLESHLQGLSKGFSGSSRESEARLGRALADKVSGNRRPAWLGLGKRQQRPAWDAWQDVLGLRLEQTEAWAAEQFVRMVRSDLAQVRDQLGGLLQELNLIAGRFPAPPTPARIATADPDEPADIQEWIQEKTRRTIRDLSGELVDRLAAEFTRQHVLPRGGMPGLLESRHDLARWLPGTLRGAARTAAVDAIRKTDVIVRLSGTDESGPDVLRDLRFKSSARLAACGGGKRLLAVLPHAADSAFREAVGQAIGEGHVGCFDFDNELVFCQEFEQMPFGQVAATICENNRGFAELAARLHTRIDVAWKRLEFPESADERRA